MLTKKQASEAIATADGIWDRITDLYGEYHMTWVVEHGREVADQMTDRVELIVLRHVRESQAVPNVGFGQTLGASAVVGRMVQGAILTQNRSDGSWWLSPVGGDAIAPEDECVSESVAKQLEEEGMIEPDTTDESVVRTTWKLSDSVLK